MGKMLWEEEWHDFARTVGGGSYRRQYARALWDGWATPTSGVLWCENAPGWLPHRRGAHGAGQEGVLHVVKKKTTEKDIAEGHAHVLPN